MAEAFINLQMENEMNSAIVEMGGDSFVHETAQFLKINSDYCRTVKKFCDQYTSLREEHIEVIEKVDFLNQRANYLQNVISHLKNETVMLKEKLSETNILYQGTSYILDEKMLFLEKEYNRFKLCLVESEKASTNLSLLKGGSTKILNLVESGSATDKIELTSVSNVSISSKITDDLSKGKFGCEDVIFKKFNRSDKWLELKRIQELKHENIIRISHHGFIDESFYFVMEKMEVTMETYYVQHCPSDDHAFTKVAKIAMKQMLLAIDYLHEKKFVLTSLSFHDVLVNSINNATCFKLHELTRTCLESSEESYRKMDLNIYGRFCHRIVSGVHSHPSVFLDMGCFEDAVDRLLMEDNNEKDISYFLNHPYTYTEQEMLLFNSLCSDELCANSYFKDEEKFKSFTTLKDGSWFNHLSLDTRKALRRVNYDVAINKNKSKYIRGYDKKDLSQIRRFARNFDHHDDEEICGKEYPQSSVDCLLRPFPYLLPSTYNALYELTPPNVVKCRKLRFYFNLGQQC